MYQNRPIVLDEWVTVTQHTPHLEILGLALERDPSILRCSQGVRCTLECTHSVYAPDVFREVESVSWWCETLGIKQLKFHKQAHLQFAKLQSKIYSDQ